MMIILRFQTDTFTLSKKQFLLQVNIGRG